MEAKAAEAERDRAWDAVRDIPCDIVVSAADNLELTEPGVNKGASLAGLMERLGLVPEEVMAIGDSGNDAAMLDFAGVGVAMGNGEEALKQKADLIAPTNEEGGVADMLELAIKGEI